MSSALARRGVGAGEAPPGAQAPESPPLRLNWGCGAHVATGWINSDAKDEPGVNLVADIRRGLPLASDSVDYAVSVHALPELSYLELAPALTELRRTLKPGGVLRLVLPDFDRAIDAYKRGQSDFFQVPAAETSSAGGRFLVHALWFGYTRSLFTGDFIEELLARAGFERIRLCAYRRTASPFGRIVELDNRPRESLYVEASKPRILPTPHRLPYNLAVAMEELEVLQVSPDPGPGVKGHFTVHKGDGHGVKIIGWALGSEVPAVEVEVEANGSVAGRAPLALDRPDVAEKFPDISEAATAGFQLELAASGKGMSQLDVFAVLQGDGREPLGRIVVKSERRGLLGALRRG